VGRLLRSICVVDGPQELRPTRIICVFCFSNMSAGARGAQKHNSNGKILGFGILLTFELSSRARCRGDCEFWRWDVGFCDWECHKGPFWGPCCCVEWASFGQMAECGINSELWATPADSTGPGVSYDLGSGFVGARRFGRSPRDSAVSHDRGSAHLVATSPCGFAPEVNVTGRTRVGDGPKNGSPGQDRTRPPNGVTGPPDRLSLSTDRRGPSAEFHRRFRAPLQLGLFLRMINRQ
jgi:hypothetical protein